MVLSCRLSSAYQEESNGDRRVVARKSHLSCANVSIGDHLGASVFTIHGGGLLFIRIANSLGAVCQVAAAFRRSPESRSLGALSCRPRPPSPLHRRVPYFLVPACITGLAVCSVRKSRYPGAALLEGW